MIVIIDFGQGNLGSVKNMLKKLGFESEISSDKEVVSKATKLILPGVGSFDTGISNLIKLDLIDILNYKVIEEKVYILGICLGAQLMCNNSEEGKLSGLGWFKASVVSFKKKFESNLRFPVPNIGWRDIKVENISPLTNNLPEKSRFYFVHSYYMKPENLENILISTVYGFQYAAGLYSNNIFGVQFHPEKSHRFGFKLLKNFAEL